MILKLANEEEKRSNFRTPRLQLQNVVFCFFEKFQIPGIVAFDETAICKHNLKLFTDRL